MSKFKRFKGTGDLIGYGLVYKSGFGLILGLFV